MGILDTFLNAIGGPESVCKAMHKAYSHALLFPSRPTKKEAMLYTLHSRYLAIKTIKESEFDSIVERCNDLSELVLVCITRENPQRGGKNAVKTLMEVHNFFSQTDPKEGHGVANLLYEFLVENGICPKCHSESLFSSEGGISTMHVCKKCGWYTAKQ